LKEMEQHKEVINFFAQKWHFQYFMPFV